VQFAICPAHGRGTDASRCIMWSGHQYILTRVFNGRHETDYWLGYGDHEMEFENLEVIGNLYENAGLLTLTKT